MKLFKYLIILIYMPCIFFTSVHAESENTYCFKTYNLYEEKEVKEFLDNPNIEWLETNASYIRRFIWEPNKEYYYIHSSTIKNRYLFSQAVNVWYNTGTFNGYYSQILSSYDFLKWSNIENINKWIKELGFNKEFEDYAIINVPESYPNMILLQNQNEIYILALTYYREQELIDGVITSIDDIKVTDYEQYELLKIDEFIEKYGDGYQDAIVKLLYVSVDGNDVDKDISVVYVPNEDDGYIELNDIEYIFADKSFEISVNNDDINIGYRKNKTTKKECRKMPISTNFLLKRYNIHYNGNTYTVYGYVVNNRCFINMHDISVILKADIGVKSTKTY